MCKSLSCTLESTLICPVCDHAKVKIMFTNAPVAPRLREAPTWLLRPHKDKCYTMTFDNGKEFAEHETISAELDVDVYFAHPYHSWERGLNENSNGLLRQYFPKGIDISDYSQAKLNAVARQLNSRPRKTLDYQTPVERFNQSVASTG
jgi:IS30 family transposase